MSTKALIDRLAPFCKGWNRTGTKSIADLIERGQDNLLNYDAPYMHYIADGSDNNKGSPPYLRVSSADTFRYEITAANLANSSGTALTGLYRKINGTNYTVRAKRIIDVFIDSSNTDYGKRWIGRPFNNWYPNPYNIATDRIMAAPIPVESYPSLQNTPAYLLFKEEPKVSNQYYFILFSWEAPRITAETVPLVVPEIYEDALRDFVFAEIETYKNGKLMNEYRQNFLSYWKPKFDQEMSLGAQSDNHDTQAIIC